MSRIALRYWFYLAIAVMQLASCATSDPSPPSSSPGAPSPTASVPPTVPAGAAELLVLCDGSRIDVQTPVVRPQADGVHVRFRNPSGRPLDYEIAGGFGGLGDSMPGTGGSYVFTFGPGDYQLTCATSEATFTVVDPEAIYVAAELTCASQTSGSVDYGQGALGAHDSPVAIARTQLRGLQPADVVERAGYPQAAGDQLIRVVRGGQPVAVVTYTTDGQGGWLLARMATCAHSNITVFSGADLPAAGLIG